MTTDYAALMKKALLRLEQAERELREYREAAHEPVAIVGMACRLSGARQMSRSIGGCSMGEWTRLRRRRGIGGTWRGGSTKIRSRPGKMAVRHGRICGRGGLVRPGVLRDLGDGGAGDGPAAAAAAEVAWEALEDARADAERLRRERPACSSGL